MSCLYIQARDAACSKLGVSHCCLESCASQCDRFIGNQLFHSLPCLLTFIWIRAAQSRQPPSSSRLARAVCHARTHTHTPRGAWNAGFLRFVPSQTRRVSTNDIMNMVSRFSGSDLTTQATQEAVVYRPLTTLTFRSQAPRHVNTS